uniref:Uncharacterized protein n=1 Tax=Pseudomonas fluorescens TaxID=294 RepID=A0A5E6WT53_PSEFL|nr:hypothetical protein PS652_04886 [Pseudomonas fluorescens]
MAVGVIQAPIAAHGAFAGTLPGLVEGFNQVVLPALLFGHGNKTTDETRLVDPAGQGGFALAAFARPAGFTNDDILGREAVAEHLANLAHVHQGIVDALGFIFPVGQQVNGQEVYRRGDLRVLQPELPDIGVGHRHADLAFHLVDQRRQLRAGDFLAQQGFVADDHRLDHIRVGIGRGDQGLDLFLRIHRIGVDPGAEHDLQAVLASQVRDGFKAGHRVGANALETLGEQGQVCVHARRAQLERLVERRLVLVERRVGGALQLVRSASRIRQHHRFAQAVPQPSQGEQAQQAGEQVG